jgi:hypothetical protein
MKPLGLKKLRFPQKIDWHLVGLKNWWEAIEAKNGKTRDRRESKKEIQEIIEQVEGE